MTAGDKPSQLDIVLIDAGLTVNFDNYKEKRNAVKAATRNDQKAKERELLKI